MTTTKPERLVAARLPLSITFDLADNMKQTNETIDTKYNAFYKFKGIEMA